MSESTELAHRDAGAIGAAQPMRQTAVGIPLEQRMAMLREALTNPDVDPAKAVAMADLMERMEDRELRAQFNRDKIAAIRAMPAIYQRGKSDKHRYAKFEDLHRACMPVLAAHGFTLDFRVGSEGNNITVQPVLRHDNGLVEEGGVMKGPPDTGPGRSAIQAVGSATSYLKRHSMKAILNIIEDGEDNDGALREGSQLNDRQERLVTDAQEAFDNGRYADFYGQLPPKDKALLVTVGVHARLGGTAALPGPATDQAGDGQPQQQPAKRTPQQMVDDYKASVTACKDLEALQKLQTTPKVANWIAQLRDRHPDLHQQVVEANADKFAQLSGGQPAGDDEDDQFPGAAQ